MAIPPRVAPRFTADLVAFDADTVAPQPPQRVYDLPGGADRLIADSDGVEHVWVAGQPIRRHGEALSGPTPGTVIRD